MTTKTIDDLLDEGDAQRDAATAVYDAAHDFARAANGVGRDVMPAAVAYDLLGNLKAALWCLGEVTEYLPRGLEASLTDPRIRVYDREFTTGEDRDPAHQVAIATTHIQSLTAALRAAAAEASAAQSAIASQGFDAPS